MTLWKDSERKGVRGQHIIIGIAVTEILKHWFNSQRVLLVLQDLFRNRKLKLLKFAARCSLFSCLCSKRRKNCVRARAILSHLRFWKGICKVASWIGLEILIPKHPWKSKIGLLQPILAAKRYVTFFLGHPVYHCMYAHYVKGMRYFSWSFFRLEGCSQGRSIAEISTVSVFQAVMYFLKAMTNSFQTSISKVYFCKVYPVIGIF